MRRSNAATWHILLSILEKVALGIGFISKGLPILDVIGVTLQ